MSDSIFDIGKLSEPLTKLVETVSAGIGALYAPVGTVRQAKANAKASIIQAEGQVEVATIEMRAQHRIRYLESLRQENLEKIIAHAANEMPETVSKESVSRDWTLQFITLAQDICDDDMQCIWARILAGEVSSPGTFAKRTLEFLKTFEKREAEAFTALAGLAFERNGWPGVFTSNATLQILEEATGSRAWIFDFSTIGLLAAIGLIDSDDLNLGGVRYHGKIVKSAITKTLHTNLVNLDSVGYRDFSSIGTQLLRIAGAKPVPNYIDKLNQDFAKQSTRFRLELID